MYNKDFVKYEKLKAELSHLQNLCPYQYFAVKKCPSENLKEGQRCSQGRFHVPRVQYPCIHYFTGNCKYGMNCHFSHHIRRQSIRPEPNKGTCRKLYLQNVCPEGGKCKSSHDLKEYPCYYNTVGKCRFSQEDCRYSHKLILDTPVVCFFDLMKGCKNLPQDCPNTHVSENVVKYLSYEGPI